MWELESAQRFQADSSPFIVLGFWELCNAEKLQYFQDVCAKTLGGDNVLGIQHLKRLGSLTVLGLWYLRFGIEKD